MREAPGTSALIARLRTVLEGQAEALSADDFATLERLSDERDRLVAALDACDATDVSPADREILGQIGALDQRLMELARVSQGQLGHDMRDIHGGRRALTEYQRRGQNLIRTLGILDLER